MIFSRVIPCLSIMDGGLVKTIQFKHPSYVGDPINAIKIFNDKEVDELVLLDISASKNKTTPNFQLIKEIASECFMPLSFGGGIKSIEMIREILNVGVEKVVLNTAAVERPSLVIESSNFFGNSTIVVSIDAKKNLLGNYVVYTHGGREKTKLHPIEWAIEVEKLGAGEIIINSIEQDGIMQGLCIKFGNLYLLIFGLC